ncbi:hypothetical protein SODALDRAFT_325497 [Sodiomyces alkalinus F11]|uniref:C2H2-type domain-containing protein n=1 Tax=Sodiomyces alkalinus (strain CBS 110278 / VKM F-3762 / F11) TaxID=1314773 RepID=A0A3N2PR06_SODAK|nr:hypothetical protein SODALDRAFT_325497 [Sodiomyces alkalinus F11]ROT36937.1 hypothetical protein SODALDRAFT_325497 [Sodiomyces alkalinus F11]
MGRPPFAWPGLGTPEPGNPILAQSLPISPPSDPSLSPHSESRSLTSSPPRGFMTAEQRGLKRQRDQARRESKTSVRARRAGSNPYMNSPPLTMPDVSAAMGLPMYSSSPSPASLLDEPTSGMPTPTYLPPYSPPMHDSGFQTGYPVMSPGYMGMDYSAAFQPPPYARPSPMPMPPSDPSMIYGVPPAMTGGSGPSDHGHVRVVQSRPKPQCWEHGCNGRQFSTFSNLLRHQREKSGQAAKATCPNCGAEFTRTTARNGHLLHDKCKSRRNANSSSNSSISGNSSS